MAEISADFSSEVIDTSLPWKLLLQRVSFSIYYKLAFVVVVVVFKGKEGFIEGWLSSLGWLMAVFHPLFSVLYPGITGFPIPLSSTRRHTDSVPQPCGIKDFRRWERFHTHLPGHLLTLIEACWSSKFKVNVTNRITDSMVKQTIFFTFPSSVKLKIIIP